MITGHQKAHLLLKLLGAESQAVLKHLPPASASKLSSMMGDVPDLEGDDRHAFFDQLFKEVERHRVSGVGLSGPLVKDTSSDSSATSNGSDSPKRGASLFSLDDAASPSSQVSSTEASPEDMAERLSSQTPQMVAFFLSRVSPELSASIRRYLSSTMLSSVDEIQVDNIPLSDKVFQRLYAQVSVKKEGTSSESSASLSLDFF